MHAHVILKQVYFFSFFFFFCPTREFHTHLETSPVTDKGQQIMTCSKFVALFFFFFFSSREGFLACHTYCVTDQPFIMVISKDPWHAHLVLSVWLPFNDFGLFRPGIEPRSVVFEANALPLNYRSGQSDYPLSFNFIHFVQYCLSH